MTNALVHTGAAVDLTVLVFADDGVRVEVGDGSPHPPVRYRVDPTAETGRGLALLDDVAQAWGVLPSVRGKTVWFHLDHAEGAFEPKSP